jgi:hypothetical protein
MVRGVLAKDSLASAEPLAAKRGGQSGVDD